MYISKTNLTDLLRQVSYFEQENAKLREAIMADDYDHDAVNKAKERTWWQARYTVEVIEKIGIRKPVPSITGSVSGSLTLNRLKGKSCKPNFLALMWACLTYKKPCRASHKTAHYYHGPLHKKIFY